MIYLRVKKRFGMEGKGEKVQDGNML